MGAFLHDIGKIDELTYDEALGYSDEGQMVGHLVQGVTILDRKLQQVASCRAKNFRLLVDATETHDRQSSRKIGIRQPQSAHDHRSHSSALPG